MRTMKYSNHIWRSVVSLLALIYILGSLGCARKAAPTYYSLGQGEVSVSLNSLLKGTINTSGTKDDVVSNLLIILMPRTSAAVTIVEYNTSTASLQTDTSDPSKTYITVGTKGKPLGKTDDLEIKLPKAGQYDIIFIANPTSQITSDIKNGAYKTFVWDTLEKGYEYKPKNAIASSHIRTMTMVYRNQEIGEGAYEAPFEWKVPTPAPQTPLAPVSNYPESYLEGGRVGLVRTMAKMKVTVKKIADECLSLYKPSHIKVTLHNVPSSFSMIETLWDGTTTDYTEIELLSTNWNGRTDVVVNDSYFPEKVFAPGANADWENNQATGGTMYFKVDVTRKKIADGVEDHVVYTLPLVTSTEAQQKKLSDGSLRFLDLITERDAVFSVYRNRYYQYTMSMPWDIGPQAVTIGFKATPIEEIRYDIPVFN